MKAACLVLLALQGSLAGAFEPFTISDIRVEGLERISAGTVFNYMPVKVGDTITEADTANAIRVLFKTCFFNNVSLARSGDILVVNVQERPAISSIVIEGNKDVETEQLLDGLNQIGLAEGQVFDRSLLDKVEQELQRQYFSRGKYAVKINTTVTPLERNRIGLQIDISEGQVAKIKQINIVGNHVYSDKKLLKKFQLGTSGFLSFYTKNDQYSKQKLSGDIETLRSFYLDNGYINFNIISTQVSITPDKKDIYVTINISEGEKYLIKEVRLSGDLVVDEEELFPLVDINTGDTFSRKRITESVTAISDRLGDEGYAFANVNTIPDTNDETREVSITFFVDPGKRVYVRRINFSGNVSTKDEVLRREMRQMEGGWFSAEKVERSRDRLQKLGFFTDVNVETPTVPGSTDQVDVNYSVTEQPSGNLSAGAGFSQTNGLLLNASITQNNFLGSGNRVALTFNNSKVNTVYSFGYNNPYWTIHGVSRGFGAYYRETDAGEANISDYTTDAYGANISFGLPINEYDSVRLNTEIESLELKTGSDPSFEITDFIVDHGDSFKNLKLAGSWSHDSRNAAIFPDRGLLHRFTVESTIPGSDLKFYKIDYRQQAYLPLTRQFTLQLKADIGYGDGYDDFNDLPFFENYFAGGVKSVRGFEDNTLGPRYSDGDPLGGAFRTVGGAEIFFPVPFIEDSSSFRLSTFFDVGNVFKDYNDWKGSDLRYSVGMGAYWLSPFGPLAISVAYPINSESDDDTQFFQFTLGAGF